MKLIHFSDPHAGGRAEDRMAYFDKRWVGVFNYRFRRRFKHDLALLDKAVQYTLANPPDVVVCTGDLTSTGQPGEFAQSLELMLPLVRAGIPLLYTPGNHDCYVKRRKCVEAVNNAVRVLCDYELRDLPLVRHIGGIDFILVHESRPTNLISSCGYLTRATSEFVLDYCSRPKTCPRIIVGHYPLIEEQPLLRIRHRLWGQKQVLELLRRKVIDVSLCGHIHCPFAKADSDGRGEYSAGSVTRNGTMAEMEYLADRDIFVRRQIDLQ